jgi:hypothetical protein
MYDLLIRLESYTTFPKPFSIALARPTYFGVCQTRAEPLELPLTKKKRQETSVPRKNNKIILGIFKIFLGIFIAGT